MSWNVVLHFDGYIVQCSQDSWVSWNIVLHFDGFIVQCPWEIWLIVENKSFYLSTTHCQSKQNVQNGEHYTFAKVYMILCHAILGLSYTIFNGIRLVQKVF